MSEGKVIVPDGMLKSANDAWIACEYEKLDAMRDALEAALGWLSENPIVPTAVVIRDMVEAQKVDRHRPDLFVHYVCAEWQRRMFDAPEPEVPIAPSISPIPPPTFEEAESAAKYLYGGGCGHERYMLIALQEFVQRRNEKVSSK